MVSTLFDTRLLNTMDLQSLCFQFVINGLSTHLLTDLLNALLDYL